jgi:diadenosine tetraphosphatase ApaH/serine/threonine PP2A family protein phosphatase
MPRHIFIGDPHGCYDEVMDLLEAVGVRDDDRVIAVGDLTRKGPAPDRLIELWRSRAWLTVLGNNDLKVLKMKPRWLKRWIAPKPERLVLRRTELLEEIASWPLYLDFPEIGVAVVHGGVLPNSVRFSPTLVPPRAALTLRHVRRDATGAWTQVPKGEVVDGDPFWADVWDGDRLIVYGHTPRPEPAIHRRAIGLDTGCVYGGKLSAAVFEEAGKWKLVSVPARSGWAGRGGQ